MRNSEIKLLAGEIVHSVTLPVDRAADLKRGVRAADTITKFVTEFVERVLEDAVIEQDEAWNECAVLLGFKDLDDLQGQGYVAVLKGSSLQLRKHSDA